LPTAERPLRAAEFDRLFAETLIRQERVSATGLRLWLSGGAAVTSWMRDLAARETECCSFFQFAVSADEDGTMVDVAVPAAYVNVLDALAARAEAAV
jgi:hypothetical protein